MLSQTLAALVALPLAIATPIDQLAARAGGPEAKPIPDSCSLVSISPAGNVKTVRGSQSNTLANSNSNPKAAFSPTTAFRGAHTTYSFFQDASAGGWDENARLQQCLEQCYGFGGPCTGVAWGHNVDGEAFGQHVNGVACLFMGTQFKKSDLVPVTNGSWTQPVAVNINC